MPWHPAQPPPAWSAAAHGAACALLLGRPKARVGARKGTDLMAPCRAGRRAHPRRALCRARSQECRAPRPHTPHCQPSVLAYQSSASGSCTSLALFRHCGTHESELWLDGAKKRKKRTGAWPHVTFILVFWTLICTNASSRHFLAQLRQRACAQEDDERGRTGRGCQLRASPVECHHGKRQACQAHARRHLCHASDQPDGCPEAPFTCNGGIELARTEPHAVSEPHGRTSGCTTTRRQWTCRPCIDAVDNYTLPSDSFALILCLSRQPPQRSASSFD